MITFQQFMETIAQLGSYTGDYTQARMAMDKHEEGDASFDQIETWVKSGLIQILERIKKFFDDYHGRSDDLEYVLHTLQTYSMTTGKNTGWPRRSSGYDIKKSNASLVAEVSYRLKNLYRYLDYLSPAFNIGGRKEYDSLMADFSRILSQVRSSGTKELVSKIVSEDSVPVLLEHLNRLIEIWMNNNGDGYVRSHDLRQNLQELEELTPLLRTASCVEILDEIGTTLRIYYSSTNTQSDAEGPSSNETRLLAIERLKEFAKHPIASKSTPKKIMNAVNRIVAQI